MNSMGIQNLPCLKGCRLTLWYQNVRNESIPMNVSYSTTLTEKAEILIGNPSACNEYKIPTSKRRNGSNTP